MTRAATGLLFALGTGQGISPALTATAGQAVIGVNREGKLPMRKQAGFGARRAFWVGSPERAWP